MQLPSRLTVAGAILFLIISPCHSFISPITHLPSTVLNVHQRHILRYPSDSRELVLSHFLRQQQYLGESRALNAFNGRNLGPIPFYTTSGHVALNPIIPAAPFVPSFPVPEIPATEAPTLAPTTTPEPAPIVTLPPATEAPAPVVVETEAPPPPPAPVEVPAPAPPAPIIIAAPAAPAPPQVITIQQPSNSGFPSGGIIAVQPIITHGGFLNLGAGQPAGVASFLPSNLAGNNLLNMLQSFLAQQQMPAASEAPAVMEVVTDAPTTTAAPVITTTLAPETTQAPTTTTAAPLPVHPVPVHPVPVFAVPAHPGLNTVLAPPQLPAQNYLPQNLFDANIQPFGGPLPAAPAHEEKVADASQQYYSVGQQQRVVDPYRPRGFAAPAESKFLIRVQDQGQVDQGDYNLNVEHSPNGVSSGSSYASFKSYTPAPGGYGQRIASNEPQGWNTLPKQRVYSNQVHGANGQYHDIAYGVNNHNKRSQQ